MHFKYQIIPAGHWSRIEGSLGSGSTDEDRPHLVPLTKLAENLVSIDSGGFIGRTGLCPGEIEVGGQKKLAYRFQKLTEADAQQLLDQLDEIIRDLSTQT